MSTTEMEALAQSTAQGAASGMICPIWFVGTSGSPPNVQYHYYAQHCPAGYGGVIYGMSSTQPLQTGCGGGGCIPADVILRKKHGKKAGGPGPIGGTQSHTLNHVFRSSLIPQTSIGRYLDPNSDVAEQPGRVRVLERRNYLVSVGGQPLAVRLFLTLTSPPNDDPEFPHPDLLFGFGGEIDPETEYLFDGSHLLAEAIDSHYVQIYRRQEDLVFHVLTVQAFPPQG